MALMIPISKPKLGSETMIHQYGHGSRGTVLNISVRLRGFNAAASCRRGIFGQDDILVALSSMVSTVVCVRPWPVLN